MTLQQLRYVIQAADSRSMNEAAKALYISQPSLSEAIKELEKEIGIELFKRSSHGTVLTPEGEEFLGYNNCNFLISPIPMNTICTLKSFNLFSVNFLHINRPPRSEERRVGKECRSRWSPYH